jgi:signal transduction histidine kinase/streptogramin lyase
MMRGHRPRGWLLASIAVWIAGIYLVNSACALDPTRAMSQYIQDRWGADQGFVGGTVYAICQSDDGYLWIGTERGLVRFDGFTFTLIQHPLGGLSSIGPVRGLVADPEGNLWIRLDGPHLLLYREGRFEDAFARFGLREAAFTAMSKDDEGRLLLSGFSARVFRYKNGEFETVANTREVTGTIISVAETRDEKIWMGTRNSGLFRLSEGKLSDVSGKLTNQCVNALLPSSSGGLWLGTDAGIEYWDGNGVSKPDLPSSMNQLQILTMTKDRDSNVWVGTDHGLVRITWDGAASLDQVNHTQGNAVIAVYEDRDGDLWYGGSRGIERLRNGVFSTYSTAEGLPSNDIGPVYVDLSGRTWFAPLAGGLYWLKDNHVERVTLDGLDHDIVYSISGGGSDVWIGRQRGGLTHLTISGNLFMARTYIKADGLSQNSVYSVHRNRDGTVWAGTVSAGVSRLRDGVFTNYSVANGMASNSINSIVEGSDGTMWFGTQSGITSYVNGHWVNRSALDGLPASNVGTIFEDSKQVLWIATSAGLAFLSGGHIGVPQNLPEPLREQIFGIAEGTSGSLWIATSDHVLRLDRDRLLNGSLDESDIQSYGTADGLRGAEGVRRDRSVIADPLGRVWIGLSGGLAVTDPRPPASDPAPVKVRVESMSVGGNQINLKDSSKIAAGTHSITFKYESTNLSAPERVRFRYRLDGSDQGWSDSVAWRQVIYSNLGPGSYRFHVLASNAEGLWNDPETIVPFSIAPSYWQTSWFRALFLSGCVLTIVALYRLRMHQLTQSLNARFQERIAERTRIAQELHDTLLQGFLSASMQLDVAEDQIADDSPGKPLVGRVLRMMAHVIEEGRNALQGLRSPEAEGSNLETAFSRMRQEFSTEEKIGYRVIAQSAARPLRPLIRDEVYRIGREALANAFLHAKAKSIEVELEYGERYLRILVRDDGCGIDPQVLQAGRGGHWGLPGMRERSEGIGASLKLRSRVGAGTEIELIVPSGIAFEGQSRGRISKGIAWLKHRNFEGGSKRVKETRPK